jgi:hypothetical protein
VVAHVGLDVLYLRQRVLCRGAQQACAVTIEDVGGVYLDAHQQAAGIHQNVAFPAVELLRTVVDVDAAALGILDRLAVDARGRRLLVAPGELAYLIAQPAVHASPQP